MKGMGLAGAGSAGAGGVSNSCTPNDSHRHTQTPLGTFPMDRCTQSHPVTGQNSLILSIVEKPPIFHAEPVQRLTPQPAVGCFTRCSSTCVEPLPLCPRRHSWAQDGASLRSSEEPSQLPTGKAPSQTALNSTSMS